VLVTGEQHLGLVLVGRDVVADLDQVQIAALIGLSDTGKLRETRIVLRGLLEKRRCLGVGVVGLVADREVGDGLGCDLGDRTVDRATRLDGEPELP
jgi:hypothetical protein